MLLRNLKAAVIHNHPIHYKHLLFQEMKKQQLDFVVLFQASQSSIRHEKLPLSDDLYRYRIAYDGPYETAPATLRAHWTWSELQKLKPDFLLISGYYAIECWVGLLWGALRGVPRIMWYESNEFDYKRHWYKEIFKRIFLKGCCSAHVYGRSNKAYLVKLGMPSEKISIKRAVVDIEKFDTAAGSKGYRKDGLTRIISVGRMAPEKNIPVLLKAFAKAADAQAAATGQQSTLRLIIAGTGPDEAAVKKLANDLGIGSLVEFKGYTPQKELGALYREADFFVLPSTREPWGLVALEAMLCRLPALISTQCGCAADVVTPNTGWTFSPWNENELAVIFEELPAIPVERIKEMGDAAHDLAKLYSAEDCATLVAQSLRRALGTSKETGRRSGVTYAG
jgi:glycosyltransferase involved in cell wall biosynthesis